MKIATWNVNSIRTRLDLVTQWLQATAVDVLCLQETKVTDADFPQAPFVELGYHCYVYGQKSYNGVALISRAPLDRVNTGFAPVVDVAEPDLDQQKRVIQGVLGEVCLVNLYVPNGSAVGSEKYDYKLRWLKQLRLYLQALLSSYPNLLVCGDFNVALDDRDIHDPSGREQMVMATDAERTALTHALLELGLADGFRKFHLDGGHFSWWDYRAAAFRRNLGWRIDHHYLSAPLYERAIACTIDVAPRQLPQPSDHTPVIIELED
ncbi:MAG: exodeoxyribonuclease III [Leptolyngbyaceae cyanobacterium SL_7_1]|nr:exodeoxyribonuclease III [Leptolyngbyaceae cyanobacterium SL_7_1]